jgi:hypothetical protein
MQGPVVVAGAGPSLDDAIDSIGSIRERIVLLAVDTAVAPLLRRGLEPDVVLVLDAQVANLLDFVGVEVGRLAVMADLSSAPGVLRRAGRLYLYATRFAPLSLFDRLSARGLLPTTIPAMGSVGVTALHAAISLTTGPVLVAGLDFAYSGGRTHAKGTPGDERISSSSGRLRPAESLLSAAIIERRPFRRGGVPRGEVLTDLVLEGYAGQAARIVAAENRVFVLGHGGLDIGAPPCDGLPEDTTAAVLVPPETCSRWHAGVVADLVSEEMARLKALVDSGTGEGGVADLQAECDYLTIDWPTADLSDPQRILATAQFRRTVSNCGDLWRRTGARLAGPGSAGPQGRPKSR